MTKLSVVIPIWNTPSSLLNHCIESIEENLHKISEEVEVLCINDGSTEPHVEKMLKQIENVDHRFRYIFKQNSGVANTRNMGIYMAKEIEVVRCRR